MPRFVIDTALSAPVGTTIFVSGCEEAQPNKRLESAGLFRMCIEYLRTNNINLEVDFSAIGFTTSEVQLESLDKGGYENISVNGSTPITIVDELTSVGNSIGGIPIDVFISGTIGDRKGVVILRGAIKTLRIGGAEF